MKYFLSGESVLKWLETPSVYNIKRDDLYELDHESFEFLRDCSSDRGSDAEQSEFIDYCLAEGILTRHKVWMRRPSLMKSPVPSLRYLELQITDRCNLRCKHCYIGDRNPPTPPFKKGGMRGFDSSLKKENFNELPVNQIRNILKEFEDIQGLRVLITGGEPLIHSRFKELNEMLPEFLFRKVLFTNGLLLDRRMTKMLHVDEIQISIDGLEEAHDSLRGRGAFRSAMEAVRQAMNSGFEVSVSTMIHPGNLRDFERMEILFKDMGIKDWTVDVPCMAGRLRENRRFHISPEEGGRYLRYGFGAGLHSGASGFACGLHLMAVMADGRVAKCTFYADDHVGRIKQGLRNCWKKIRPVRLDELACDCVHIDVCRGGCRYRAELLGDPFGRDLYKCVSYDIMSNGERA
jgi:radical SAM protein with 4Fe4S-binding SPASM domain